MPGLVLADDPIHFCQWSSGPPGMSAGVMLEFSVVLGLLVGSDWYPALLLLVEIKYPSWHFMFKEAGPARLNEKERSHPL